MKESISKRTILNVMVGCLVIGGLAAIIGMFRAEKNSEPPFFYE